MFVTSHILIIRTWKMQYPTASVEFIPLFCFLIAQFHHLSNHYLKQQNKQ